MLSTVNIVMYGLNKTICIEVLQTNDLGGSVTIHMFGAYYGLAAAFFFSAKNAIRNERAAGSYTHQLIAMTGTLFLFMYWPSFNAA